MASHSVTVDASYFKTLLRRAELHATESDGDIDYVRIPKHVHQDLLRESREYHILRQTLLNGGVASETIDLLIQTGTSEQHDLDNGIDGDNTEGHGWFTKPNSQPVRLVADSAVALKKELDLHGNAREHGNGQPARDWAHGRGGQAGAWPPNREPGYDTVTPFEDVADEQGHDWSEQQHRKGPRNDNTLLFRHLPEGVTHKDVTNVIRGGRLVDVWLRKNDRAAQVTFAEGAADFLAWSRKNDIIISGKRTEVVWSDRQYTITSQLASKLKNGHSRNLVIREAASRLTESQVREDMEHIHNLVISACVKRGRDLYLSTNSIDKATFARNCMLSRLPYKGLKIEWYPDECAEPIPKPAARSVPVQRVNVPTKAAAAAAPLNRFNLLSVEDNDGDAESTDSFEDDASRLSGMPLARSREPSTVTA